jgi:hypothetical protein
MDADISWMRETLKRLEFDIKILRGELEDLREQIEQLRVNSARVTTDGTTGGTPDGTLQKYKFEPLPPLPPFDDTSDISFRDWRRTMAHNLMVEGDSIGSKKDQWIWVWTNLGPQAQNTTASYFLRQGPASDYDVADFLDYLASIYENHY